MNRSHCVSNKVHNIIIINNNSECKGILSKMCSEKTKVTYILSHVCTSCCIILYLITCISYHMYIMLHISYHMYIMLHISYHMKTIFYK